MLLWEREEVLEGVGADSPRGTGEEKVHCGCVLWMRGRVGFRVLVMRKACLVCWGREDGLCILQLRSDIASLPIREPLLIMKGDKSINAAYIDQRKSSGTLFLTFQKASALLGDVTFWMRGCGVWPRKLLILFHMLWSTSCLLHLEHIGVIRDDSQDNGRTIG